MKAQGVIISRMGKDKIHGYTVRFSGGISTYHIHSYKKINPEETQKTVNARLKKLLNELIDDRKI